MKENGRNKYDEGGAGRQGGVTGFLVLLLVLIWGIGSAVAFNIPTGNDDLFIRWDNTIRYTLQQRLHGAEGRLISDINSDDGDRNFDVGIAQNRFDLFSEADLIFKRDYGVRVSGAVWYDARYDSSFDNDSVATSNHLENGQQAVGLSDWADKYFRGPAGEVLDAFAFGRVNIGEAPVYLKAGRHTVYWGEALLSPFNGINFGQAPLDLGKATATPGVEVKEVFRPLNQVSAVAQVSNSLTLAAQYFLQWEQNLVPEGGTYLAATDLNLKDSEVYLAAPGFVLLTHGEDIEPEEYRDFGVSARWSPESLHGGTVGFYFRNTSDHLPQAIFNFADSTYHFAYGGDIQIYGLSYANTVFGGSMGSEVSIRRNMPLRSDPARYLVFDSALLPDDGELLGARGDTFHATVNFIGLLKRTPMWDSGSYTIELNYSSWMDVSENEETFKGHSNYNDFDAVTRDACTLNVNFGPQWLQILPGVDVTMPFSVGYGLWGVASEINNGAKGEGSWGVGFNFDIFTKYKVNLNYVDFFGDVELTNTGAVINRAGNGAGTAGLRDRDFVSLTLKTSF
ncbi:MAG: DUF1302 family protein [Desulfobacterales bacterium]|jgi:hypothetical protein|nr:DUF1302 family protein [Desulfobacterales bacterium]